MIFYKFATVKHDPFEKLYPTQTREDVNKKFGTPNQVIIVDNTNVDRYYQMDLLNHNGELVVSYDKNDIVTKAYFHYDRQYIFSEEPSSEEKDEAREYFMNIISYYTEKYGTPDTTNDNNDLKWRLPDDSEIKAHLKLDAYMTTPIIDLWWVKN